MNTLTGTIVWIEDRALRSEDFGVPRLPGIIDRSRFPVVCIGWPKRKADRLVIESENTYVPLTYFNPSRPTTDVHTLEHIRVPEKITFEIYYVSENSRFNKQRWSILKWYDGLGPSRTGNLRGS